MKADEAIPHVRAVLAEHGVPASYVQFGDGEIVVVRRRYGQTGPGLLEIIPPGTPWHPVWRLARWTIDPILPTDLPVGEIIRWEHATLHGYPHLPALAAWLLGTNGA